MCSILLVFAAVYYFSGEYKKGDKAMPFNYAVDAGRPVNQEIEENPLREEITSDGEPEAEKKIEPEQSEEGPHEELTPPERAGKLTGEGDGREEQQKIALIIKDAVNVRRAPDILAPRIGMLYKGETAEMHGEKRDADGRKWYKLHLPGNKEGWIAAELVTIK